MAQPLGLVLTGIPKKPAPSDWERVRGLDVSIAPCGGHVADCRQRLQGNLPRLGVRWYGTQPTSPQVSEPPTLTEFCFSVIGRANIEGSKSNIAVMG